MAHSQFRLDGDALVRACRRPIHRECSLSYRAATVTDNADVRITNGKAVYVGDLDAAVQNIADDR
jgi:hypothetical protein